MVTARALPDFTGDSPISCMSWYHDLLIVIPATAFGMVQTSVTILHFSALFTAGSTGILLYVIR